MANYTSKYYTFLKDEGVVVPDTSEILTDVQNEWMEQFGTSISVDASTPQGRLIELDTTGRKGIITTVANVINQVNLNYATGQFLDALGGFFDLERHHATRTKVGCTLYGVAGTTIPANSRARTTGGDIFFLGSNTTLENNGQAEAIFYSLEYGEIPCPPNTLTDIITPVVGWNSIDNDLGEEESLIGNAQEDDTTFRRRIANQRYHGAALPEAIRSAVSKVADVKGVAVFNNGGSSIVQWGTVNVLGHSLCIVVYGGTNVDVAQAIANTISCGCGLTPIQGVFVSVTLEVAGAEQTITFNRAEEKPLYCEVRIGSGNYVGTNSALKELILDAIDKWRPENVADAAGVGIGTPVYPFEICAAISDKIPEIIMQSVKVCALGGSPSTNAYTPLVYEIATISSANVTIYRDGVKIVNGSNQA